MPDSAAPLGSVKAQVPVELISTWPPLVVARAWRQNGVPELAETLCEDGVTVIEVTPLSDTVTVVDPLIVVEVAWIEAVPEETPVTNPPFVVTVATLASVVLQETDPVMVLVLPSS